MTTRTWLLVSCAALGAGILVGRYTARQPDTIVAERAEETRQVAEAQASTSAVTVDATAEETQVAHVETATDRFRIVAREKETRPDGSTRERSLEVDAESARLAMDLQASRAEASTLRAELAEARAQVRVETRIEDRRVEVHDPLPDWRIGGLVGISLRGGPEPAFGAEVQRRILGPVYVGAWGLSSGAVGGGVGLEF